MVPRDETNDFGDAEIKIKGSFEREREATICCQSLSLSLTFSLSRSLSLSLSVQMDVRACVCECVSGCVCVCEWMCLNVSKRDFLMHFIVYHEIEWTVK